MKKKHCLFYSLLSLLLSTAGFAQTPAIPLIPYPSEVKEMKALFVTKQIPVIHAAPVFEKEKALLYALFKTVVKGGGKVPSESPSGKIAIELLETPLAIGSEAYTISITPDKIILSAAQPEGMFRAVQTISQLVYLRQQSTAGKQEKITLPCVEINDAPVFSWRGMHLDVSRHFFSTTYLKKMLDVMALYKLNKFHLHLTDDQGWRIEIKKYPGLTTEGAWRTFNAQDSACIKRSADDPTMAIDKSHVIQKEGKTLYGGFYTQEEIKELVAYAAERYIEIIPEIDMPGHMMAAIHAYPYLSCKGGSTWGDLFSTPVCPGKDSTIEFIKNVLSEVAAIFPSNYIHIGGDEVERHSWSECPACKNLMQKEGIGNLKELQSYFLRTIQVFLQSKGKKVIGWDEVLDGKLDSSAYVMYWRSWEPNAPKLAVQNGNPIIMTPNSVMYFDALPNAYSLKNVYSFNPVPASFSNKEKELVVGGQACLWTEFIPSEQRAGFMYMPRMTALAERLWSQKNDFTFFTRRLFSHYKMFDALNIYYRLPDLTGFTEQNVFTDKTTLTVAPPLPGSAIRYTTDGSLPLLNSPRLPGAYTITAPVQIKLAAFNANGVRGETYMLNFKKESFARPVPLKRSSSGLVCRYYRNFFRSATALLQQQPDSLFVSENLNVPGWINAPSFGLRYDGSINVPETGVYSFYFNCDDGGILTIAGREVVNNDGLHAPVEKSGQIALQKGVHPIRILFIEGGGGYTFSLKYALKNGPLLNLDQNLLLHDAAEVQKK